MPLTLEDIPTGSHGVNKPIIIAVMVIGGAGVVRAWTSKPQKPITPVIIGATGLLLLLSIGDLFGGKMSQLMSALAMITVIGVVLSPDVFPWGTILSFVNNPPTGASSPATGTGQAGKAANLPGNQGTNPGGNTSGIFNPNGTPQNPKQRGGF